LKRPSGIALRHDIRPGDIGRITAMHGELYAAEYGWDHTFEAYVGEYLSRFARSLDVARERIWIAEMDGRLAGCAAVVRADAQDVAQGMAQDVAQDMAQDVAQLRWFIVHPDARGRGLGTALLDEAIAFARVARYRRMILDTVSDLTAAAHLYRAAGFRLAAESASPGWGSEVTEQRYELNLT
jgi:ribosomal protein S18 acetylase RimI-like enzyme